MGHRWHEWCKFLYSRVRLGILLVIIGMLWFGKRAEWYDPDIFGPLVMVTLGLWIVLIGYLKRRTKIQQCC